MPWGTPDKTGAQSDSDDGMCVGRFALKININLASYDKFNIFLCVLHHALSTLCLVFCQQRRKYINHNLRSRVGWSVCVCGGGGWRWYPDFPSDFCLQQGLDRSPDFKPKNKNTNNFWHTQNNTCQFYHTPKIPGL